MDVDESISSCLAAPTIGCVCVYQQQASCSASGQTRTEGAVKQCMAVDKKPKPRRLGQQPLLDLASVFSPCNKWQLTQLTHRWSAERQRWPKVSWGSWALTGLLDFHWVVIFEVAA